MPQSVGGAAALGLQSGYAMGRNTAQMERENARRDALEAEAVKDRAAARARSDFEMGRQKTADQLAAVAAIGQNARARVQGLADANLAATPAGASALAALEDANRARDALLREVAGWKSTADVDVGKLRQAIVSASGHQVDAFMPGPRGEPPPIVQAADEIERGIERGDEASILKGANFMYAPSLRVGVGEPSPHGGTIVGKQFVGLVPAPGGAPDDPAYIPTVRVFVSDGQSAATDQPFGATGYYDAPITDDRSTSDGASVKSFTVGQLRDFVRSNVALASVANDREVLPRLQQPVSAQERALLERLAAAGVSAPKKKTAVHAIPQGGSLGLVTTDERGNTQTSVLQGNPKPDAKKTPAQEALELFEKYPERFKSLAEARAFVTPSKAANSAAGLGGGGGDGSGLSKRDEARFKLELAGAKRNIEDLDKQEQRANESFKADVPKEPAALSILKEGDPAAVAEHKASVAEWKRAVADARTKRDARLAEIERRRVAERKRIDELDARIAGVGLADAAPGKAGGAADKRKAIQALPAGAKQIGTSNGKPVYETPDGKRFVAQ